jgi:hypothetical protein
MDKKTNGKQFASLLLAAVFLSGIVLSAHASANNSGPGLVRWRPAAPWGASPPSFPVPFPEYPGQEIEVVPLDAICRTQPREMPEEMGGGYSEYEICCEGDGVCVTLCGADFPAQAGVPPVGCG